MKKLITIEIAALLLGLVLSAPLRVNALEAEESIIEGGITEPRRSNPVISGLLWSITGFVFCLMFGAALFVAVQVMGVFLLTMIGALLGAAFILLFFIFGVILPGLCLVIEAISIAFFLFCFLGEIALYGVLLLIFIVAFVSVLSIIGIPIGFFLGFIGVILEVILFVGCVKCLIIYVLTGLLVLFCSISGLLSIGTVPVGFGLLPIIGALLGILLIFLSLIPMIILPVLCLIIGMILAPILFIIGFAAGITNIPRSIGNYIIRILHANIAGKK